MELQMALNSLYSWGWFRTLLSLLSLLPKCWEYRHVLLQKDLVKKKTVTSLKKKKRWGTASRLGCDICNWVLIWLHGRQRVSCNSVSKNNYGIPCLCRNSSNYFILHVSSKSLPVRGHRAWGVWDSLSIMECVPGPSELIKPAISLNTTTSIILKEFFS